MKYQLLRMVLAVPLLLLCAWPQASIAQAAIADLVLAWGWNEFGQTTVPVAAQSGVTAIAAGGNHTVALKNDGTVVAWGWGGWVPVAAQSGVTAIAAGVRHTVALKNDGTVVAWGANDSGQVTGTPATDSATASPVTLGGQVLSGVKAIAAGWAHTVALKNDGSVVAWGSNQYGQRTVPLAAQSGVTAIAAGGLHTVALKNDGSVVAWGNNQYGQRTVPLAAQNGVTAIAAGGRHTVALKNDGTVVAWGLNNTGQVTGTPTTDAPYSAIASPVTLGGQVLGGVTAIAAGENHTVALKNDGTVVAWGYNNVGQATIPLVAQGRVSAIAAGSVHTVALVIPTAPSITTQPVSQAVNEWRSASFTVVATGYPLNYQWRKDGVDLAEATSATYSLPFAHTNHAGNYTVVVSNSAGSVTSAPPAVLTVNPVAAPGTVVAWGCNEYYQTTVPVAAQSGVTAIAAGGYGLSCVFGHTVALKNDGSVVAWGYNTSGQVTGTPTPSIYDPRYVIASPVTLGGQVLSGVTAIAAGGGHTVALKNDGSVVSWGGLDQTTVPVAAQSGVTAIAAGLFHTVALKCDGSVVTWGAGGPTTVPVAAVMAIAAGESHTVALKNDGSVVVWGSDETVPLAAQSGVTAIAAGYRHTVALKSDGSVVSWGGLDQTTVPVAAQSGVTAIAAGGWRSMALKNDGTVVEWGDNGYLTTPVTLGERVLSGVTAIAAGINHTVALLGGVQLLPSLKARPNGNELILSWPTNAVGFTLQSTLDLTPPITWLDSTSMPAVIGAHFTLTNTTSGRAQFYRLSKM